MTFRRLLSALFFVMIIIVHHCVCFMWTACSWQAVYWICYAMLCPRTCVIFILSGLYIPDWHWLDSGDHAKWMRQTTSRNKRLFVRRRRSHDRASRVDRAKSELENRCGRRSATCRRVKG